MKNSTKAYVLFIWCLVNLSGCKKPYVSMTFENIFLQNQEGVSDNETVLFYVKVNNSTGNDFIINEDDNENVLDNSGFYLISDFLYSGAIKLRPTGGSFRAKIIAGKSRKIVLFAYFNQFKKLMYENMHDKYSYQDLKTFFDHGNYTLAYISFKEPKTMNVPKSLSFKTIENGSPDTLNKILMP